MDPEEEVKTPTVPAPAEGEEVAEDDEDEFDEELEEEEEDDANCSEDETPYENVAPHEYLLDCSYEAIKICNIDFLTDFGSAEPFLVDGDALVAHALANPYLDKKCGLQLLHVTHIVENTLSRLKERGANFNMFFFEGNAVLWKELGKGAEMAHYAIMQHFLMVNRKRELACEQPVLKVHALPGSWWDSNNTALQELIDQCGPSYIMTDFGWSGSSDRVLHLTRAFVNHLHLSNRHVVTFADMELKGSHIISNNMQPPRHPKAREKIGSTVDELLDIHKEWISACASSVSSVPAVTQIEGDDIRESILVAAMKHVASTASDVGKGNFVTMCIASSLAQHATLLERCFPFSDESFAKWKESSATAKNADTFLNHLHGAIAGILSNPESVSGLHKLVAKDSLVMVADVVDGRLFHVVLGIMVAEGSEGLSLSSQVSFRSTTRHAFIARHASISLALLHLTSLGTWSR